MPKIIDLTDTQNQPIYVDYLAITSFKRLPLLEISNDGEEHQIFITQLTINDGKILKVRESKEKIDKLGAAAKLT